MGKKIFKYIILLLICAGALLFAIYRFGKWKYQDVPDLEHLYDCMLEDTKEFRKYSYYVTDFIPAGLDYYVLQEAAIENDPYKGANLYGLTCTYKESGGKYYINLNYSYYINKVKFYLADHRISRISKKIEHLSDYDKVKAAHDYIVRYCEYSYAGYGAYNTLFQGLACCNGYALSFFRIMQECEIPVTFETGDSHAWNRVYLDGYWYNIDLTWDDGGGKNVNYTYFLKCDADWVGHEHGGADAPASLAVTGSSAEENYNRFPHYQLQFYLLIGGTILLLLIVGFRLWYKADQKKRAKRKARLDAEYEQFLNQRYDDF